MGSVVRGRRTITLKQKLKAVRIIATGTQFQGDTPPAITLKAMPQQFEAVSYSWTRLRDNKVLSTAQQITVKNGEVDVVETYRVEVKDRLDDVYIDTLSITKVTDGKPGDVGKRGQVIVQREWKEGDIYRNNDNVIDYVYHRATDSWWRLRDGYDNIKAGLNPSNQFVQLTSLEHLAVNNFVAENANIAGFIFKDKVLKSQLPNLTNPNLILDGVNGKIIANDAQIKGHIEGTSGSIKNMTGENITVTNLNATNGSIKNITGDNITINSGTFKGKVIFEDGTSAQDAIDQRVKEGVESIQVGGRNYFSMNGLNPYTPYHTLESKNGFKSFKLKVVAGRTDIVFSSANTSPLYVKKRALMSGYLKVNGKTDYSFRNNSLNTYSTSPVTKHDKSTGYFEGYTNGSEHAWMLHCQILDSTGAQLKTGDIIEISDFMYEVVSSGNIHTSWSPAYEDLDNKIDNIQSGSRNYIKTYQKNLQIRDTRYSVVLFTEPLNGVYTIAATRKVVSKGAKGNPTYSLLNFMLKGTTTSINHSPVPILLGEGETKFTIDTKGQIIDKVYIYSGTDWAGSETIHTDITDLRIVKGNITADWTESLEDINARIKDQELYTEYSVNGTTAWHTPATSADRFMRQKKGDGAWSVALPFGKDGVNGKDGNNGLPGKDGKYTISNFAKNTSLTVAPTTGWSANPPALSTNEYLWQRFGDVIPPATAPTTWTIATRISGLHGQDGQKGDRGPEGIQGPVGEPLGDGVMLYTDPDFSEGTNSVTVYVGAPPTRVPKTADAPTKSTHMMRMSNTGQSVSSTDLRRAGFVHNTTSRANAEFVHKMIAKFPVGHTIINNNNPLGTGSITKWLTSRAGTGRFEVYMYKVICGYEGSFSTFGHVSFTGPAGTAAAPINYDIAYSTIFDMSIPDKRLNFLTTTIEGNSVSTGTLRVGQGNAATAGITGVRASGATSNVSFWAGLSYENRESAPFQVWTDGRLKATNADITGKITATSGEFTGKVTATSGTFTGTVNANAGTFNNVTANNLTVNSGTFKGRIEAESGYFGGFLVNNQGMINDITKNDHKLEFGYQVAWTGIKSALGMNYKFMYSEGTNALVHNCNSQIVNTATTGTDHNVALLLTAARSAGGRNHALVIEKGDIAGMALYTKHFGVTDNIQIYRESVVIYTPINGSWICHVSLPTGEYRYDGRTVTIMCAGNGKTKIIGRDAVIYSHEGHHSVGKVDNYIDFFNNSSKVTMTYSAEKNWWFVTHINIH